MNLPGPPAAWWARFIRNLALSDEPVEGDALPPLFEAGWRVGLHLAATLLEAGSTESEGGDEPYARHQGARGPSRSLPPVVGPEGPRQGAGRSPEVQELWERTRARVRERSRRQAAERELKRRRDEAVRAFAARVEAAQARLREERERQREARRRPGRQQGHFLTISDEELLDRALRAFPRLVEHAVGLGQRRVFLADLGAEVTLGADGRCDLSPDQFERRWRRLGVVLPTLN
jgi:hypothetical protein